MKVGHTTAALKLRDGIDRLVMHHLVQMPSGLHTCSTEVRRGDLVFCPCGHVLWDALSREVAKS